MLAILHDDQGIAPMELAGPARGLCEVVWVVDSDHLEQASTVRFLRKLGTVVDVAAAGADGTAEALRAAGTTGIFAHSDATLALAASLAGRLGLPFQDEDAVACLTDKGAQRAALRRAGLPVPGWAVLPAGAGPDDVDAALDGLRFPAVVKPATGAASRDTVYLADVGDLRAVLDQEPFHGGPRPAMVVEEYLVGAPRPDPDFADYLSVESVVSHGTISHAAVSGRFPPAEPFRELGLFVPAALAPGLLPEVLAVAGRAVAAVGVRTGFCHTEIKLTPAGPRVIEVNGRLGGGVPAALGRAAGVDVIAMAMRVALGEHVAFEGPLPTHRVGYLATAAAPQWASRVEAVEGLEAVSGFPGVESVELKRRPGDALDWRQGSVGFVYAVVGSTPDLEGLKALKRCMAEDVVITYG